jgi:predicted HicB family RNase H-like nuclease
MQQNGSFTVRETCTFVIDPKLKKRGQTRARKQNISFSGLIREALKEYLKTKK